MSFDTHHVSLRKSDDLLYESKSQNSIYCILQLGPRRKMEEVKIGCRAADGTFYLTRTTAKNLVPPRFLAFAETL
jgi:hypothetical protein